MAAGAGAEKTEDPAVSRRQGPDDRYPTGCAPAGCGECVSQAAVVLDDVPVLDAFESEDEDEEEEDEEEDDEVELVDAGELLDEEPRLSLR
ncbi:hypothetical protein GCM10010254_67260 [Streptomyces chromofuscus]|nr:hypothetical protein GCM10010254_67260 [Streptomyces chromofuscus]